MLSACATDPCLDNGVADPALHGFHDALHALERGEVRQVRVLHLGDSHIAGDSFSGALQSLMAARFGDAGRGQMPPGSPFRYYRRQGFSFEMSDGWTIFSVKTGPQVGPFGLSGHRAESASANDWMSLEVENRAALKIVRLQVLAQPGGGSVSVELNGTAAGVYSTSGPVPELFEITLEGISVRQVRVRPAGDGPIALLGWGGETDSPGISYEAQGFSGATLNVLEGFDPSLVAAEIAARPPHLIVLGFGTNEGFDDALNPALYRQMMRERVEWLRAQAPGASLLVIGAFDGARLPQWARVGTRAEASSVGDVPRSALPCEPLALHERATYAALTAARDPRLARWHAPLNLSAVRDVQKTVSMAQGLSYWDGEAAMGGACGIHKMTFEEPPLAYGDHVHLTPAGAQNLAEKLWAHLMAGFGPGQCGAGRPR
ncbi:MAG: hypothetical protein RLN89_10760 [Parvibaculum sp.]